MATSNRNSIHSATLFDLALLDGIILLLPTYLWRFRIGVIGFNVLDIVIVTATAIWFVRLLWRSGGKIHLQPWGWSMLTFLGIGMVATIVSPHWSDAFGLFKSYIILPLLVGSMVLTLRPPLDHVIKPIALLVSYIAAIAVVQYVTGTGIPEPWDTPGADFRVTSVFEYPNAVGLLLAPLVAMLFAYAVHKQPRWWLIGSSLLGLSAIVLSRSDGALVAVVVASFFTLLFTRWRWFALSLAGAILMAALIFPPTRDLMLFQDTSGEVRLALWQGTINLLSHHPIFGAGLAGFPTLYAEYKLDRHVELLLYSHNLFLDFWVELGILGLIWLVVQIWKFFTSLWRQRSQPQTAAVAITLMSSMIAILVYGLVDVPYFKNDLAVLFWIILTLGAVQSASSARLKMLPK